MEERNVNGDIYKGVFDGHDFEGRIDYANGGYFEGKTWLGYRQSGKGKFIILNLFMKVNGIKQTE